MTKQIDGIANKGNNADWSARSKANSYHADKGQLRHDLGGEGALKDFNAGDVKDWRQPQKDHEGRRLGKDGRGNLCAMI